MSKPGSERLETHPVYSHQLRDGTVIGVAYCYLLNLVLKDGPADDHGGVRITLSDEDGVKVATIDPVDAVEIGSAIITAAQMAIEAKKHGAAPDAVPAEWTGEAGPV